MERDEACARRSGCPPISVCLPDTHNKGIAVRAYELGHDASALSMVHVVELESELMGRLCGGDDLVADGRNPQPVVAVQGWRPWNRSHSCQRHLTTVATPSPLQPLPRTSAHVTILIRSYAGRVDPQEDVLYGPRPVQRNGNVSVPRELLSAVGLEPGKDRVHWALNPRLPGSLVLIPSRQVSRAMDEILAALGERA